MSSTSGVEPSGKVVVDNSVRMSFRGSRLAERRVIRFGHSQEIGDDQQRERPTVGLDEITAPLDDELVQEKVGQPHHEVFIFLEPLGREHSIQQRTMLTVLRWVEADDVLCPPRKLMAMGLDERRDVVALWSER